MSDTRCIVPMTMYIVPMTVEDRYAVLSALDYTIAKSKEAATRLVTPLLVQMNQTVIDRAAKAREAVQGSSEMEEVLERLANVDRILAAGLITPAAAIAAVATGRWDYNGMGDDAETPSGPSGAEVEPPEPSADQDPLAPPSGRWNWYQGDEATYGENMRPTPNGV